MGNLPMPRRRQHELDDIIRYVIPQFLFRYYISCIIIATVSDTTADLHPCMRVWRDDLGNYHPTEKKRDDLGEESASSGTEGAASLSKNGTGDNSGGPGWTFLTNHSHVLICIAEDASSRSRDIAARVGITERAVQRIVMELCDAGYVTKIREGRRNRYSVHLDRPLRHPVEGNCSASQLLKTARGNPPG